MSVLTNLLVSVDIKIIEPCFGVGHSLSLICQLTSRTLCFVCKFSCRMFHSLIHAYMYINNARNLISVHQ